ncbi:MAG: hypothetical protein HRT87_11770 [Legionellales bacterium]|nr:hypothetical protein [Legionellales bacterium]
MNKDTINIDGKTYVRQNVDSNSPSKEQLVAAERLIRSRRKLARRITFGILIIPTMYCTYVLKTIEPILSACMLGFFLYLIIALLVLKFSNPKIPEEYWDLIYPNKNGTDYDWRRDPSNYHLPGNFYYIKRD